MMRSKQNPSMETMIAPPMTMTAVPRMAQARVSVAAMASMGNAIKHDLARCLKPLV